MRASVEVSHLPELGTAQIVTRSRRQPPRLDFAGSDSKHRDAVERIAGTPKGTVDHAADGLRDPNGRRASALVYLAADLSDAGDRKCSAAELPARPSLGDVAVLISMVAPASATPDGRSVIEWAVRRAAERGSPVVNAS